jgi:hypothetical protein
MSIAAVNGETGGHENEQMAPEEPTMAKPQTSRANVLSCILLHHPRNPSSVIEVSVEFCSFSLIIDNI